MSSPEKLAANIWFHSLHVPKWGWMRTLYSGCVRAIRRRLVQLQPDIVHGQGTERECAVSAVLSGFPGVLTIHGNMTELARVFRARIGSFDWLAARLENFALKRTGGTFCNSAYTESLVRPRTPKTWRAANPIRRKFFDIPALEQTADRCIFMNVGVVCPRKRQLELLELLHKVHADGVRFEVQFIGPASPSDHYASQFLRAVAEGERLGYARYLGVCSTDEIIAAFDQATALIHFPIEEAFGLVVPEALARGLYFLGTRTGGIIDICAAVPGTELFAADDWNGLRGEVEKIARRFPHPRNPVIDIMRARFHPEVIARQHLEIYREVLSKVS